MWRCQDSFFVTTFITGLCWSYGRENEHSTPVFCLTTLDVVTTYRILESIMIESVLLTIFNPSKISVCKFSNCLKYLLCIDPLHIMGMQPIWGTKQTKIFLFWELRSILM